jgi:dephospho-CoA kinase
MKHNLIPFIGVTGGIGSGKSMVCRIFSCLGIPVFEADKEAKIILNQNGVIKKSIKDLLGSQAYTEAGAYNPTWVREKIKENPSLITLINSIVHPIVRQKALQWQASQKNKSFIIYESALIHSGNKSEIIDKLIVITAKKEDRIKRINLRQSLQIADIKTLMEVQPSEETYLKHADFNIKNSHNDLVWPQIEKIYKSLSGLTLALVLVL